jgi:hypothetical protein
MVAARMRDWQWWGLKSPSSHGFVGFDRTRRAIHRDEAIQIQ